MMQNRTRFVSDLSIFVPGLLGLILALSVTSCQRSSQFRKDGDYAQTDDSKSNSASATQKIETMVQPKKHILVFNFWNDTPVQKEGSDLGSFAAQELKRGLSLTQKVILDDAKTDLKTEDFIEGDHVRVSQLIREGRRLGVAILAVGRISKVVFRQRGDDVGLLRQKQSLAAVDVEMKLFDIQGGREIIASRQSGEASANALLAFEGSDIESASYRTELTQSAIREAVSKFVSDVVQSLDKLTWQGRIARLLGQKVYINAGKASGLISGDILRVLHPGDEVFDPLTGSYLGRAQGQLKGTLEIIDFLGSDAAIADIHTGGNFKEGDLVQLY